MRAFVYIVFLLVSLMTNAQIRDSVMRPAESTIFKILNDSSKIDFSGKGWQTGISLSISDPCKQLNYTFWPLILRETCKENPMHCRHCGKELKTGESFCYVVMKVEGENKYADWIHIRCAIKRIR